MAEENKNNKSQTNNDNSNVNEEGTKENASVGLSKVHDSDTLRLRDIVEVSNSLIGGKEKGLINERTKSSIVIRQNGQINLASTKYSQYKLNPSGKTVEESLESVTVTNRKKFSVDDLVINEHKINPFLYELTDMKDISSYQNDHMLVGNFTVFGTVLVKAWEPELKRYVLIRRLARMPMFSPLLNVPEINPGLNISDPLKVDHNILAKSEKGYQVNKPLKDRNSLIGKEGIDRASINRNPGIGVSENPATLGVNNSYNGPGLTKGQFHGDPTAIAKECWKEAKVLGRQWNINPALIYGQWYHETGAFTSDLMEEACNFGGLTQIEPNDMPQPDGNYYYMKFSSIHDYASYFGRIWCQYVQGCQDSATYCRKLKDEDYYGDDYNNYKAGVENGMNNLPAGETI